MENKLFEVINALGGADASDEYTRGWDEAISAVLDEISKFELTHGVTICVHDYDNLKNQCQEAICENVTLRADCENKKRYSDKLESILKAVNLLTDAVTNK